MKTFTYNTLPTKSKQGAILIAKMYKDDNKKWCKIYIPGGAAACCVGAEDHDFDNAKFCQNYEFYVIDWVKVLKAYGCLTQEVEEELFAYIYGEE